MYKGVFFPFSFSKTSIQQNLVTHLCYNSISSFVVVVVALINLNHVSILISSCFMNGWCWVFSFNRIWIRFYHYHHWQAHLSQTGVPSYLSRTHRSEDFSDIKFQISSLRHLSKASLSPRYDTLYLRSPPIYESKVEIMAVQASQHNKTLEQIDDDSLSNLNQDSNRDVNQLSNDCPKT